MIDKWQTSVADADMADWVTVAAYLVAALVSARASRDARIGDQMRDRVFWLATSLLLVLLGINELLDLQTLLTSVGREHAEVNGWYSERREVQYAFILTLTVAAIIAVLGMLWFTRQSHGAVRLALVGLVFIGLFVLLRAASFHRLDELFGLGARAFNWGSVQEIVGIIIVAAAAALYIRRPPTARLG